MLMPGLEAERPSVEGIVRDGLNRYADEGVAASGWDTLKFQMRTPVEETAKLIAVHNLSEAQSCFHLLSWAGLLAPLRLSERPAA